MQRQLKTGVGSAQPRKHFGRGYPKDTGSERDLRDAIARSIQSGTAGIHRAASSGMLGL
jgi:hypothetical protein